MHFAVMGRAFGKEVPLRDALIAEELRHDLLRGQVEHPDQIEDIRARVRRIPGVADVEVLLHLPGTPTG